jgi:hypothetical protein
MPAGLSTALVEGGLAEQTRYSYRVVAYDHAGNTSPVAFVDSLPTPACVVTQGEALHRLGSLSGFAPVSDVAIDSANELAVVAVEGRGLSVVRLDTPSPSLASVALAGQSVVRVAANGGFAYALVSVPNPGGARVLMDLVILDLRQPAAPTVASRLHLGEVWGAAIAVDGTTVYASSDRSLQVWDVSIPAAPRIVGLVNFDLGSDQIAVGGGWVYIQHGVYGGFSGVDVRNPARPVVGFSFDWGQVWIASHEGIFYSGSNAKVRIWDFTNPTSPRLLKDLMVDAVDGAFAGNRSYFALKDGIGIWDVSNPAAPVSVGRVASGETIKHIRASGAAGLVVTISQSGVLTAYSVP